MAGVKHLLQEFAVLLQYLPYLFGMMIFMILFQFVLAMIRGKILATVEKKVDIFLSQKYVSKLLRLPFSYFQQWETGDIMGRYQDMDFVRNAISGSVLTITFETVMAIAGFFHFDKNQYKIVPYYCGNVDGLSYNSIIVS